MQSQSGLPELSTNGRGPSAFAPEHILRAEDFVILQDGKPIPELLGRS